MKLKTYIKMIWIVFSLLAYGTGYYNMDLGYNLSVINCNMNTTLADYNGFLFRTPDELYISGVLMIQVSMVLFVGLIILLEMPEPEPKKPKPPKDPEKDLKLSKEKIKKDKSINTYKVIAT